MGYKRICITRRGYAIVPGDTDEEAVAAAKNLDEHDFEWERVDPMLIESEAEIVEDCDVLGQPLPMQNR